MKLVSKKTPGEALENKTLGEITGHAIEEISELTLGQPAEKKIRKTTRNTSEMIL